MMMMEVDSGSGGFLEDDLTPHHQGGGGEEAIMMGVNGVFPCSEEEQIPEAEEEEPEPAMTSTGPSHILELLTSTCAPPATAEGGSGSMAGTVEREQLLSCVHVAVFEQLKNWGIPLEPPGTTSRGRSRERKLSSNKGNRADNGANRLVETKLKNWAITVKVPILIKETCDFLREHITTEGIFRKSGSSCRVQTLMQRFQTLERNEPFHFSPSETAFDVASVLKQYLRQMQVPVIPSSVHHLFRRSLEVPSECSREDAVLICTCLLSENSVSILAYLIEFLMEVVENSERNKMSCENLAIVMGPNIMPVDSRRSDKAKELEQERKFIEAHTKIIEILIRNGQKLSCLPQELQKKAETDFFSQRASEDDLENDEVPGRRRKRRSGSLTRVLGFLRKVTKTGDTPVAQTPDFNEFTHTPMIKSGKRRCLDENIFSLKKKKTILDGIRKNGLCETPDTMAGFITCPSPVCLNPSPTKRNWTQTPNAGRFKNLVTPSLLRRKDKNSHAPKIITPMSAPPVPIKTRFGLGKSKSSNKQAAATKTPVSVLMEKNGLSAPGAQNLRRMPSTVSIRKLNGSPKKVMRASSTRIPRPDKPNPVRKSNSAYRFPLAMASPRDVSSMSGEYVKISPSARISDIKNEAFIASKLSCLEDSIDIASGQENEGPLRLTPLIKEINTLTLTAQEELTLSGLRRKRSAAKISGNAGTGVRRSPRQHGSTEKPHPPPVPSRSTRRRSSGAFSPKPKLQSPPTVPSKSKLTPGSKSLTRSKSIRQVEDRFMRAVNETKIMRIQSERSAQANPRAVNVHRRFSIQARGLSPSQRRIARRRSQEMGSRPHAQASTPLANGLSGGAITTPLNDLTRLGIQSAGGMLSRSPNRCTLKRGRPNTVRAGLARPSPMSSRNNSVVGPISNANPSSVQKDVPPPPVDDVVVVDEQKQAGSDQYKATPMRRMSSVQELVKIMEKTRTSTDKVGPSAAPIALERVNSTKPAMIRTEPPLPKRTLSRRTSSASKFAIPTPVSSVKSTNRKVMIDISTPRLPPKNRKTPTRVDSTEEWVPASNFNFETQRMRLLKSLGGGHPEDRDSIQALKTMNAGKVSQNVRLFDGMCRSRKSPGKSLIPRYVALHRNDSMNNGNSGGD